MDFDKFINQVVPKNRIVKSINPPISDEEKKLFILAKDGTKKKEAIITIGDNKRQDAFFVRENMGKGPYHLFELHGDNTTNLAREWITHISALAKLYYEYNILSKYMTFEYNYTFVDKSRKSQDFPMDIVIFEPGSKNMILYVEVKKREKEVKDLLDYLKNNKVPFISDKDREVSYADEIRKAKYLWHTRVKYLWLVYPDNLKTPEDNVYEVIYDTKNRKIELKPIGNGIRYITSKYNLGH